jgi:spermidine/putrescine transport system ATP-binding protein
MAVAAAAEDAATLVASAPADIRLERVTKRFDDVLAVDDLTLDIERGAFFALLGPSGCGKTTTLRMIGGFEDPTEGRILLADRDVTGLPPYKRDVNTVFQGYALFPHLSIGENVAFGLRRKGIKGASLDGRVREILKLVALEGYEKRKPRQLSGGQQQRVALARALVNSPQVLLLDEPLGALDLKLRKQMQLELKRIQHDMGITFVHVTHDQEEAMTMADVIAVMNGGKIEQLGGPTELYERPRTAFVAGFLGVSNLLRGTAAERGTVRLDSGDLVRVPPALLDGRDGPVAVGIRPEKIRLGPRDGDENALSGTVAETAYVGVATQVLVDTGAGRLTVYAQNDRPGTTPPGVGNPATLSWSPDATFVVDPPEEAPTR